MNHHPNDLSPTSPRPLPTRGGDLTKSTSPPRPLPYGGRGRTGAQGNTTNPQPPPLPRGEVKPDTHTRRCRACGCTDNNACQNFLTGPCSWVETDLCSACQPKDGGQ